MLDYVFNVHLLEGPHSHFEEVKLEANPAFVAFVEVAKPALTTEPQYEECGGGVTNSGEVVHSNEIEEPAYQNVQ